MKFIKVFLQGLFSVLIIFPATNLNASQSLTAKIEIPYQDSLVRGDVPVFGKACGKDFKEFLLDYGQGKDPKDWTLINRSDIAQKDYKSSVGVDITAFGKTIDGNLGTWDAGLDEYKYGKHPVNLSGIYTLRLRVLDSRGNVAEDKIPVEIGHVILNSIGGKAESRDGMASFKVAEHSLYTSAILVSLKVIDKNPFPQDGLTSGSKVYELREPGEKFTQPVTLTVKYDKNIDSSLLRIYSYDTQKKDWQPLNSELNEAENTLSAKITQTPLKFALYGIFLSRENSTQLTSAQKAKAKKPKDEIIFQYNTFKEGFEEWHTKYPEIGAKLSLAKKDDGTSCLMLSNQTTPSNFSSSIINEPFDVKKYSFVRFDYNIPKDIKINFQVRVGDKWYEIVFTGDEKIYWDVNMEKIGRVESVIADDKWHIGYFNLYDMLKDKTNDFVIQEFTMADWDITGFMKLELGHNKKEASYCIGNFVVAPTCSNLMVEAWKAFDRKDFASSRKYANSAIDIGKDINQENIINDVATCRFILAEILRLEGKINEAKSEYQYIVQNYPQAKCWNLGGWFWKVADTAKDRIFTLETGYDFGDYSSEYLTNKAWEGLNKKDYRQVDIYAEKCIYLYKEEARSQQNSLKDFAPNSFIPYYWSLNNVGTCYFILGETNLAQKKYDDAKRMYQEVIDNYAYARCWEPRGWFWKVSKVAKERLQKIK